MFQGVGRDIYYYLGVFVEKDSVIRKFVVIFYFKISEYCYKSGIFGLI